MTCTDLHPLINFLKRVSKMREKEIEKRLVQEVRKRGGLCWKFTSPGTDGVPDRLILMPCGKIAFVELKATGEKMRPLQKYRKLQLEKLCFDVYCIDDVKQITGVLNEIQAT